MTGSTYLPIRWIDVDASKVQPNAFGFSGTITAGQTQNIDALVSDDSFVRSIGLICKNHAFGDIVSFSVIDKDAVYFPANTVLAVPISNWNINSDTQSQGMYESIAPQKILGGLYIRISYNSNGLVNVGVACNMILNKVLV